MNILNNQHGGLKSLWIFLLGIIILASVPAYKIVSVQIQAYRIASVMKILKEDSFFKLYAMTGAENIRAELLNRFELERVPEITPAEITVTQAADQYHVRVAHRYRVKIIMDQYFMLDVDESAQIPLKSP